MLWRRNGMHGFSLVIESPDFSNDARWKTEIRRTEMMPDSRGKCREIAHPIRIITVPGRIRYLLELTILKVL